MNRKQAIISLLLGVFTLMPSMIFARERADSLVLNRIFTYQRNYGHTINGTERNVYIKYTFDAKRRNATLFFVPTMYAIAKGERQFMGEDYCKLHFKQNVGDYDINRQVFCSTIPHRRNIMPAMLELMTPNLYDISMYKEHILSPFHRSNRHLYRYATPLVGNGVAKLEFSPRSDNTQLVKGWAYVDLATGRILDIQFSGEYDMIAFHVDAEYNKDDIHTPLPDKCITDATFQFIGNKITSQFTAKYNCEKTLPDSVRNVRDYEQMKTLRPIPLDAKERAIYQKYLTEKAEKAKKKAETDSAHQKRHPSLREIAIDMIGDYLVSSHSAGSEQASVRMSPLLNPLYLSYSHKYGVAYQMKIRSRYNFSAHRYLTFNPRFGYNFKFKRFYITAPLRMTYNPKRNGYVEMKIANGNPITNSTILDDIKHERRDTIDFSTMQLDYFNDNYLQIINNIKAFKGLEIEGGIIYHQRTALHPKEMKELGKATQYRSFTPTITFKMQPWTKGPLLSANYERGLKVIGGNTDFERWEFDASYKKKLRTLRILNIRTGGGFYTQRKTNYFVDFANFHDQTLPDGWDDEWTGQFQLLDKRWYNASNYYLRSHVSYESPMLFMTRLPYFGRFIETERLYLSTLSIERTRPYSEIGYGFSNRFFSVGLFASFLNADFEEFGCKVTLELFRRW